MFKYVGEILIMFVPIKDIFHSPSLTKRPNIQWYKTVYPLMNPIHHVINILHTPQCLSDVQFPNICRHNFGDSIKEDILFPS